MTIVATNPLITGQDGAYGPVFAPNGRYDLVITANGYTFTAGDSLAEFVFDPTSSKAATGTYTADDRDVILYADASGGNVTINLPALSGVLLANRQITIIKVDSSVNTVTLVPNGADTINGAASLVMAGSSQWSSVILIAKTTGVWASVVRFASTAPAANAVPISGADTTLPSGWAGLLGVRYLFSGTSYTPTTGTHNILVELIGGGGGGGGTAATGAGQVAVAAGGGAGTYARKYFTGIGVGPYTYAIGALGAGASAGNNNGGAGGNTTFTGPGPVTVTAPGGGGGQGSAAAAPPFFDFSPNGGASPTNADFSDQGDDGDAAIAMSTAALVAGKGAASFYGGGGARVLSGVGQPAQSFGAGGSGGATGVSSAAQAGGNGKAGIIVIYEFS